MSLLVENHGSEPVWLPSGQALGEIEPVGVCEAEAMCECPTVGVVHENPGQVRPELDTVLGLEQSKLSGEAASCFESADWGVL